jgi:hypothetical protein
MSADRKMTWDELAEENETLRGQLAEQDARGLRLARENDELIAAAKDVEQADATVHNSDDLYLRTEARMQKAEAIERLRAVLRAVDREVIAEDISPQ